MIGTRATRWDVLLTIGAGGALGSLARFGLSEAVPHPRGGFPVATLATNVLGCLLIGVLMGVLTTMAAPHRLLRPFLGIGVLGGFTTFSTYVADTLDQFGTGHPAAALVYAFASVALSLLAAAAGLALVRR
jgi:CrcB protein